MLVPSFSYLVFDELHLLDPERSFATVLGFGAGQRNFTFLLMTASFDR